MKKIMLAISGLILLVSTSYAFANRCPKHPPIHLVSFHLQAEEWVKTDTAKVVVSFNGTTHTEGLTNIHHQILENLSKIYPTEWNITYFNRHEDKSGLERIRARAEARLPESALAKLRKSAKAVSKPGATFKIDNIFFSPSLIDREQTRSKLRKDLYAQAKAELNTLNKLYPDAHYTLHRVLFDGIRPAVLRSDREVALSASMKKVGSISAPMTVSQKLIMTAEVQLAMPIKNGK